MTPKQIMLRAIAKTPDASLAGGIKHHIMSAALADQVLKDLDAAGFSIVSRDLLPAAKEALARLSPIVTLADHGGVVAVTNDPLLKKAGDDLAVAIRKSEGATQAEGKKR